MQMRNVMPPMTLIARRIPRHILELTYTIKLPILRGDAKDAAGKPVLSPQQLLESYCQARGLFRARALGESDMPRAARQILKDFTDGRLLFCHPPASGVTEVRTLNSCLFSGDFFFCVRFSDVLAFESAKLRGAWRCTDFSLLRDSSTACARVASACPSLLVGPYLNLTFAFVFALECGASLLAFPQAMIVECLAERGARSKCGTNT